MSREATHRLGRALAATCSLLVASAGCRGQPTKKTPIVLERNMFDQERYDPQSSSTFFNDRASMRTPVAGTLAREAYVDDESVATGVALDGSSYVMTIPDSVVAEVGGLAKLTGRGRERFGIYCAPCHGATGDGKGVVARVPGGFPPLPSLLDPRVASMPDGQLYATIANGVRNMPPYAAQIPRRDRWAIVAYVRALELSLGEAAK